MSFSIQAGGQMKSDHLGRVLRLAGRGKVVEILPFVFQDGGSQERLFFDRFARLERPRTAEIETTHIGAEVFSEAIALLDSQVATFDLVPGLDPQSDPVGYAALIAAGVHMNQQDKLGFPYIEHPRRVFLNTEWAFDPEQVPVQERVVAYQAAWLHDAIEDSAKCFYRPLSPIDLANWGFDFEVIATVMKLTRNPENPTDPAYYEAIRLDEIARGVKLADIADNLARWRTALLTDSQQTKLAAKYEAALEKLDFSKQRDGDWFELRLHHFDQGPLATFSREESKTALARAKQARSRVGATATRPRPTILDDLGAVPMASQEIIRSRFWEHGPFPKESSLPERYSLEGLYAAYLSLYAAGQAGDQSAQLDSQLLAEVIDPIDRSEASFEFQHFGLLPRDITSHDIKLRFSRAVNLLNDFDIAASNPDLGESHEGRDTSESVVKRASMAELIDAAFLEFQFGLHPGLGRNLKYFLVEIENRNRRSE